MRIKLFEQFINESKDYPLYKGVSISDLISMLKQDKIIGQSEWESQMRKNMRIKHGISATRNFSLASHYGTAIIEFNTKRLTDFYKITPFSENPDFYLAINDLSKNDKPKGKNWIKKALMDKRYGKEYWDYKTNKYAMDFQIAEEIIDAKEIPILKFIKKIYLEHHDKKCEDILKNNNIPYEIIGYIKTLSELKYKNKKVKAFSIN